MPVIHLSTFIKASPEIVFDLARNIDLHADPSSRIGEKAIAGKTSGLISLGEFVTWEGKPFGFKTHLTTKIMEMRSPEYFRDEQQKGPFQKFKHQHFFETTENGTLMRDEMEFEAPFWIFGKMVAVLVIKNYLTNFLKTRNSLLKEYAENGKWKELGR